MKKIFVVGGMGAGKSCATQALVSQGLPFIDLDKVGHDVLRWPVVKEELSEEFGADIMGPDGEVDRKALAAKAFVSASETRKLNRITMPRIEEAYSDRVDELEAEGVPAVVVEYSVFKNREMSLAYSAAVVLAVLADGFTDWQTAQTLQGGEGAALLGQIARAVALGLKAQAQEH